MIKKYEQAAKKILADLIRDNHPIAVEIMGLPETIRGFGHVKTESIELVRKRQGLLWDRFYQREDKIIRIVERVA